MSVGRRYWPLLAIGAAINDPPITPMQLQKALFLIGMNLRAVTGDDYYEFEPYLYGPFAKQIYRDVEDLAEEGLISLVPAPDRSWHSYELTPNGRALSANLQAKVSDSARHYIEAAIRWVQSTPTSAMLRAIYDRYPQFADKSIARIDP